MGLTSQYDGAKQIVFAIKDGEFFRALVWRSGIGNRSKDQEAPFLWLINLSDNLAVDLTAHVYVPRTLPAIHHQTNLVI